jgi:murein DD-endopeptidase MepM/ murein hydrolase activator NlpD
VALPPQALSAGSSRPPAKPETVVRRLLLCLGLALLAATPAGADDIVGQKHSVDARMAALSSKVAATRRRELALRSQIASASTRIRLLERQVGDVSRRLAPLEEELRLRGLKLERLNDLVDVQTQRLGFLREQHAVALARLNMRIVAIYESDEPDTLSVLLSAHSFSDVLDAFDYIRRIADEDRRIADAVGSAKHRVEVARSRTRILRARVRREAQMISVRVAQERELRAELLASHGRLTGARAQTRQSLASLGALDRREASEMDALQVESARLETEIQAAQQPPPTAAGSPTPVGTAPSAAGLIWPVVGPVTSPFGMRWGRLHTGIDIGVAEGTPIHAAAAGRVIIAGWVTGYGELVFIDHGGGLSTGYAHQSQLAVSVGESVGQGQVIGYVGCTGHCYGPHLHFEVRVNGVPVDPLGYLP